MGRVRLQGGRFVHASFGGFHEDGCKLGEVPGDGFQRYVSAVTRTPILWTWIPEPDPKPCRYLQ